MNAFPKTKILLVTFLPRLKSWLLIAAKVVLSTLFLTLIFKKSCGGFENKNHPTSISHAANKLNAAGSENFAFLMRLVTGEMV
jgi:hypothetical protein